jgi:hypothetical protein
LARALLQPGDRVRLWGGYDNDPEYLAGTVERCGTVLRFIPGQNQQPAAVVELDEPIDAGGICGRVAVLELRAEGARWLPRAAVHIELCDFDPEPKRWQERRQGVWIESAAMCDRIDDDVPLTSAST